MRNSIVKRFNLWKKPIGVFVILLFCCCFQALRCVEYPGLYLDAVNPDYLAVQFLFPQINNPSWTMPHTGPLLLGQLYHGTLTIWFQILIVGITGSASMVTIRIVNAIYVLGISWCFYLICKQVGMNELIMVMGTIAMIFSPQVYSFVRTQYYIKLPGTFLLLLSLYFLIVYGGKREKGCLLIVSGILCGMAFYSYFIYLFFVPAMLVLCLYQTLKGCRKRNIIVWLIGFSSGASLYVMGYFDFVITCCDLNYDIKKILVYIFDIMLGIFLIWLCRFCIKSFNDNYKIDKLYWILIICLFVGVIILINSEYASSAITPFLDSLNIAGKKMNMGGRVKQFFVHWENIMSNNYIEYLMLNAVTSIFGRIYITVLVVSSLAVGVTFIKYKHISLTIKMIGMIWLLMCSYFICALVFISRMWGQHFTSIFFLSYMIIIMNAGYLYSVRKNLVKGILSGVLILLLVGNINSSLLSASLKSVGGNRFYSSQINKLAENALMKKNLGENEVYIFPEWGFLCGFNYLTLNQVLIMTDINENRLNELLSEGYKFKLCAWDREMERIYKEKLENIGIEEIEVEYVFSNDGSEAFYILSLREGGE